MFFHFKSRINRSQECQSKAWFRHHQYECNAFKAIRARDADELLPIVFTSWSECLENSGARALIRLLSLHNAGKISNEDMNDFKKCVTCRNEQEQVSSPDELDEMVEILTNHVETNLSKREIEDLIYAVRRIASC
jgi:hypothetical protein